MTSDHRLGRRVAPLSIKDIKTIVIKLKEIFNLQDAVWICPVRIIEAFQYVGSLEVEIIDDADFPSRFEAITYPDNNLISIRQSVYDRACLGDARSRFTLAHELGHICLHTNMHGYAMLKLAKHAPFEDSEWQADEFAAELLMPSDQIDNGMSISEVMSAFGVSRRAAMNRLKKLGSK